MNLEDFTNEMLNELVSIFYLVIYSLGVWPLKQSPV